MSKLQEVFVVNTAPAKQKHGGKITFWLLCVYQGTVKNRITDDFFPILNSLTHKIHGFCVGLNSACAGESELSRQRWMFDQQALQEYILLCCQNPVGGLVDKPGK